VPLPLLIAGRVLTKSAVDFSPVEFIEQEPFFDCGDLLDMVLQCGNIAFVDAFRNLVQQFSRFPRCHIAALLKHRWAATVLGRRRPAAADTHRIKWGLLGGNELLDPHLVFPTVGEIVFVQKALIHTKAEVYQPYVSSIPRVPGPAEPGNPVFLTTDAESVKVVVGPGECDLDEVVEVGERAVRASNNSPPDHRVDVLNPNMYPVRGRPRFLTHGCQLTKLLIL